MQKQERQELRKSRIAARDALTAEQRMQRSEAIVSEILSSQEFLQADTILIYKGIRGEVRLEALEEAVKRDYPKKRLAYPLCISKSEMIALVPHGEDSWKDGFCGIREPLREKSDEIPPEAINLVICPCTVFDEEGGRMGMGAGFYDRYLPQCTHAAIAAVAFEVQKADCVPMETWDRPMDLVFTEHAVYKGVK